MIDLQDGVLLDDAEQKQQAETRKNIDSLICYQQREDAKRNRQRQRQQNRDRVNERFELRRQNHVHENERQNDRQQEIGGRPA